MMPGIFPQQQQSPNLGEANMAHLMALSQQGNPTLSHGALIEQATSQAAMQEMAQKKKILKFQKSIFILLVILTQEKHGNRILNKHIDFCDLQNGIF